MHSLEGALGASGWNILSVVLGIPQLGSLSVGKLLGDSAFSETSQLAGQERGVQSLFLKGLCDGFSQMAGESQERNFQLGEHRSFRMGLGLHALWFGGWMQSLPSKVVCCKDNLVKVLQKKGGLHLYLQCFPDP